MIGSSENRISYNGNGIATEFAYTFKILEKSDMKVLHVAIDGTETLLVSDYYVDMEKSVVLYPGYSPGAEIPEQNRPPILPVGERLVLYREVPITQESALDKHWPFNVIENGLDKLTIICQQIWDRLQRSFYVSESTSTNFDPKVPIEAGKTFRVKDDGTGFEVTEDPGKVIDGATALLKQTTEQAESANEAATNAQNAANTAEKIATDLGLVDEAVQTAAASANTASNKADVATAKADIATTKASEASTSADTATQKAEAASTSATSAAQSYANTDAVATQLTEYLATKESLTAPAVDKTLLIDGAAADAKVVGELKSDLNNIGCKEIEYSYTQGYFITSWSGQISEGWSNGAYSEPIEVTKGDLLFFNARGYQTQNAMICTCDSNGDNIVVRVKSRSSNVDLYTYECTEDGYVVVCFCFNESHRLTKSSVLNIERFYKLYDESKFLATSENITSSNILSDFNQAKPNTVHLISTLNLENMPINHVGILITLLGTENYFVQYYHDISSATGNIYYRNKVAGVWNAWNKLSNYDALESMQNEIDEIKNNINKTNIVADNLYYGIPKMGIIGDSLASGATYDGTRTLDHYEYSWGKHMERASGQIYKWFSFGGATTRSWLSNQTYGLSKALQEENYCNCYIMGLMVNDQWSLGADYLGTISDIKDDFTQNSDTFYGNYAKIIQNITSVNPNAKFFVLTNPRSNDGLYASYNQAVKDIANKFGNVYLIDMYAKYNSLYTSGVIANSKSSDNHYPAYAYAYMSKIMGKAISDCMADHYNDFKYVQFE